MTFLVLLGVLLCIVAAMNFVLSTFLAARENRKEPLGPYVAAFALFAGLFSLAIGVAYLRAARGLEYDIYYRSGWIGWLGLAPITQAIVYLKGGSRRAQRVVGVVMYALWGGILVLCWTTNLVETGAISLWPFVDRRGPFEQPARALGAAQLLWVLYQFVIIRRASTGRRRQQLDYFLFGTAFYSVSGLLLAGVAQLGGGTPFDPGLVGLFTVVWIIATSYAITRHRLFDIRIVLSRLIEALAVTGAFTVTNIVLFRVISIVSPASLSITLSSLIAASLLFMTPLSRLLRAAPRKLLLRRRYDYQHVVKIAAQALAQLSSTAEVVGQLESAIASSVAPVFARIFLRDGATFYESERTAPRLAATSALVERLQRQSSVFVRDEENLQLAPDELRAIEQDLGAGELVVGFYYQGKLDGFVILGRKKNRDAFLQVDIDLLETLATEAAIALANARLVDELRQAIVARDDFLSVAGHELRTPLTALQLQVQVLATTADNPARLLAQVPRAERQIGRLTRLIDELLDVTRITSGRLTIEREEFDLADTVRENIARFADEVQRSGGHVSALQLESVVGRWDRIRIGQLVANLLSNAIKYGRGMAIDVALTRRDGRALLQVSDHGIGIRPEDHGRIFERFERANLPRQYGGLGLGLWITKQVVEAHGGSIAVQSEPEVGSTFSVELPI